MHAALEAVRRPREPRRRLLPVPPPPPVPRRRPTPTTAQPIRCRLHQTEICINLKAHALTVCAPCPALPAGRRRRHLGRAAGTAGASGRDRGWHSDQSEERRQLAGAGGRRWVLEWVCCKWVNVSQADAVQTLQAANPHTFRLGTKLPSRAIPSPVSGLEACMSATKPTAQATMARTCTTPIPGNGSRGRPGPTPATTTQQRSSTTGCTSLAACAWAATRWVCGSCGGQGELVGRGAFQPCPPLHQPLQSRRVVGCCSNELGAAVKAQAGANSWAAPALQPRRAFCCTSSQKNEARAVLRCTACRSKSTTWPATAGAWARICPTLWAQQPPPSSAPTSTCAAASCRPLVRGGASSSRRTGVHVRQMS